MKNLECQVCQLNPSSDIKGFLSYSKQLINSSIQNFHQRLVHKLTNKNIKQVELNDAHICFEIDQNVCSSCWQFMYEGFYCSKCKNYNQQNKIGAKICCYCKVNYCNKCERELDLFSQNQLCQVCQTKENFQLTNFLISYLICLLIPCLAFKYLLNRLLETINKINYSYTQRILAILSFTLVFPIIYCLSVIFFIIVLIFKLICQLKEQRYRYEQKFLV